MSPATREELVLVVDDDASYRALMERMLERAGYAVEVCSDGEACLATLGKALPAAVLLNFLMPGMDGLEVLAAIKTRHRYLPVVMLTAETTVEAVVSAMQLGAYDYLPKGVDEDKLLTTVKNAVERNSMSARLTHLEREAEGGTYGGMLGSSLPMKELFRRMDRISAADITALIYGESGTGKELIARAIHDNSGRKDGPFIALNCAAVAESLQESELFGHEKGSFTGADKRRIGKFEQADSGTLFLDEVGELSLSLQAKLLRSLEERSFQRVGGETEIHSDFRLLAATNKDLAKAVKAREFREDLYFRIAVFELAVPALRDRGDDISRLATHFLEEHSMDGDARQRFSDDVVALMAAHTWPGNVRELRNAVQHCLVEADDDIIQIDDLPERIRGAAQLQDRVPTSDSGQPESGRLASEPLSSNRETTTSLRPALTLEEIEKQAIEEALQRHHGNISAAIRQLKIGRATFYRKLKKYGLR